jgi:hypothetical protein
LIAENCGVVWKDPSRKAAPWSSTTACFRMSG